jgi:hypothetical protein
MNQDTDLYIFDLYMQGLKDIQNLGNILVCSLEVCLYNFLYMNIQHGYWILDIVNMARMALAHKDFRDLLIEEFLSIRDQIYNN